MAEMLLVEACSATSAASCVVRFYSIIAEIMANLRHAVQLIGRS